MISALAEPRDWSAGRWWITIALVFGLQVAAIVWLKDRSPPRPRKPAAAPVFRLMGTRSEELLALEDPTLFALPHLQGFSGKAWLEIPPLTFPRTDAPAPERWLLLSPAELGVDFEDFARTNRPPPFQTFAALEPELKTPGNPLPPPVSPPSRLRIEGELAGRVLLSRPSLPSFTNTDLLTNSVVQLLVDARGGALSAVLMPPGSGSEKADQFALDMARNARFKPLPLPARQASDALPPLSMGTLVFEWQTRLAPATNAPAKSP
jgi:hypothetical protein